MMKKSHILHWAMGVVMTPLLGSCAADDIGDAGGTPALPEAARGFGWPQISTDWHRLWAEGSERLKNWNIERFLGTDGRGF